ncbi:hypothetical protein [uncultured Demequina sp.]|uniref:hypothetical protein n=1 Tax=uncultured Demequina sp. TaxID=693499 RepID=UPI0025E2B834|nr:hypothetical protein [uncultured Demequina sp.]
MLLLMGTVLGAFLGYGAVKIHPLLDGGAIVGIVAGALGGYVGARWFGEDLAAVIADSEIAGIAAAGALGGIVLALVAGPIVAAVRKRRAARTPDSTR